MIFTRVVVELWCDTCKKQDEFVHDTKTEAVSLARQSGWKIGKYHTCPECNAQSVAPWASAKTMVENPDIEIIALPPICIK